MAKVRRVIQKVERAEVAGFDNQLWPINLALLVLTGFVAGFIIAGGGFGDPRLLHNGWFRLLTLLVSVGGLFIAALRMNRRIARRMQLAIVLSLIAHIGLALVLKDRFLELMAEQEAEPQEAIVEREAVTIPEYILPPLDQPLPEQAFEEPVEVEIHEPHEAEREPVEREPTTPQPVQPRPQPATLPQPEPTPRPSPVRLQRQQMAAPRRADTPSKLSRQVELAQQQPQVPVAAPSTQPRPQSQPAQKLAARQSQLARSVSRVATPQRSEPETPSTVEQRQQVQIAARASRQEMTPETSSTPTLPRRVAQAAVVPRAEMVQAEVAKAAQENRPDAVQPTPEILKRAEALGPQVAKRQSEPTLDPPTRVAQSDTARRQPSEARPTLAQVEQPSPSKQPVESQLAAEAVATPENRVAQQPQPDPAPGPKASTVARSATPAPRAMTSAASAPDLPPSQASAQVVRATTPRAETNERPSLQPAATPDRRPQRSIAQAATSASPVSVESPAVAQSASQERPAARPSSAALSRARSGFVGQGRSQNADVAMQANPHNLAPVPSAAARRESATTAEEGPALSPSAPVQIAKARAEADAPAATAQALDVESAEIAGAQQPKLIAQAASAAVERRAATAPQSTSSASLGNVEVDTGPTQVVPENGTGRASGGGQPTIAVNTQEKTPERTRPGGARLAAIAAEQVEPTPASPSAEGGGSPSGAAAPQLAEHLPKRAGATPATAAPPTLEVTLGAAGRDGEVVASALRRAATAESLPGEVAGGGTEQPARGKGREVAMLAPSEVPQIEAVPHAGGAPRGTVLDAAGEVAARAASGLPGKAPTALVGAQAGPVPVDAPAVGSPGTGTAIAKATQGNEGLPTVGGALASAPLKRSAVTALPSGLMAEAEPIARNAGPAGSEVDADTPSGAELPSELPARVTGSLPVRATAQVGPGGLGLRFSTEVGLPSRRAQREAELVHLVPDKYLQKKLGGAAVVAGTAKAVAAPFARRGERHERAQMQGEGRPSAKTEAAIELGLDFLARHQSADGSWSFNHFGQGRPGYEQERAAIQADTAATGLALLAFLGAGYDHFDDKYQHRVAAALNFLIKNQRPDGDLYLPQDDYTNRVAQLYSHGIASIALCEAYGMTGDPQLGKAAQRALDFIVSSQHDQRGGWRYTPGYMSDLSVTGWQLMALRSGELAGLEVPEQTYERVVEFLDRCQTDDGSRYRYNPYAANTPQQRHGRRPSTVMTSVGLLMRLYTGWDRDDRALRRGADHLLANLPTLGSSSNAALTGTIGNPMRDTYYWYYATQVMFHMKGKYWEAWNGRLHPLLTQTQVQSGRFAGSWDPRRPVPDKWGPHGGRIYVTTLNLLSLEVYYRHLPIYEETAK